jgi:hypothetical protein
MLAFGLSVNLYSFEIRSSIFYLLLDVKEKLGFTPIFLIYNNYNIHYIHHFYTNIYIKHLIFLYLH